MKCVSCESEINPQWSHAIEANMCPFCGKPILEEHLKNLFGLLLNTMQQLAEGYQTQLDDWMLSNFGYIKTDSDKILSYVPKDVLADLKRVRDARDLEERKKFTVKVETENGVIEEVTATKLQSEEKTNDFFKRAQVIKSPSPGTQPVGPHASPSFQSPTEKTQYLKNVVQNIKKTGAPAITDAGGGSMMLPAEMLAEADPEAVAEFQQMISGGEGISSSLGDEMDDEVPAGILAANQAMAARKGGVNAAQAADLLKLQQMQDRIAQSKANFESGANRGSKGGGFSRST